jgi:hypothetical protein
MWTVGNCSAYIFSNVETAPWYITLDTIGSVPTARFDSRHPCSSVQGTLSGANVPEEPAGPENFSPAGHGCRSTLARSTTAILRTSAGLGQEQVTPGTAFGRYLHTPVADRFCSRASVGASRARPQRGTTTRLLLPDSQRSNDHRRCHFKSRYFLRKGPSNRNEAPDTESADPTR